MDVCLSKDNQVVVIHDNKLNRLCGIDKLVSEYNYADLPKIKDNVLIEFSENENFDASQVDDKTLALFDDVCREIGNCPINMEIKTREDTLYKEVYKILVKHNKLNQVVWGSTCYDYSLKLQNYAPEVARFCSVKEVYKLLLSYFLGYIAFVDLPYDTFQIPLLTKGAVNCKKRDIKDKNFLMIYLAIIKFSNFVQDPLMVHLQKRGIDTIVWVANEKDELDACLKYEGLGGIMTDRPEKFIEYCQDPKI
jgi:glycerophosphoryl diester phosphodiesterase